MWTGIRIDSAGAYTSLDKKPSSTVRLQSSSSKTQPPAQQIVYHIPNYLVLLVHISSAQCTVYAHRLDSGQPLVQLLELSRLRGSSRASVSVRPTPTRPGQRSQTRRRRHRCPLSALPMLPMLPSGRAASWTATIFRCAQRGRPVGRSDAGL